jgi:predicted dehydrogenase
VKTHKIKTAIIGLGRIAWNYHLPELNSNPKFEPVAAVDPLDERLNEVAQKWHIKHLYTSCYKMFQEIKPELVVIASPTHFHAEQIHMAFLHGANVFCEKPLGTNLQETKTVITEMKKFNRKLMVYQPRRLDPDCLQAKAIIKSGILGPIYMIKRSVRNYKRRNDWQALLQYGGGMLNNYGAHYIDQLLYVISQNASCVYSNLKSLITQGDADDFVKLILNSSDGILMDIEVNQVSAFGQNAWTIYGTNGTARCNSTNRNWKIKYLKPETLSSITLQAALAAPNRKYPNESIQWQETDCVFDIPAPQNFYDNCYNYFLLNKEPLVKPQETLQVMKIIEQSKCKNQDKQHRNKASKLLNMVKIESFS